MSRYIDAEQCLKLFDEEYKETRKLIEKGEKHLDNLAEGFMEAHSVILRMPTADVEEVVRCKNCKYCEKIDDHEWWCCGRGFPAILTAPEDYCSKGAKMDGGKE